MNTLTVVGKSIVFLLKGISYAASITFVLCGALIAGISVYVLSLGHFGQALSYAGGAGICVWLGLFITEVISGD